MTRLLRIGASHNDLTTNLVSLGVLLSVTVFTATSAITLMADEHHKEHFYNPTEAARLQWYVPYVAHLRRAPLHAPYAPHSNAHYLSKILPFRIAINLNACSIRP